MAGIFSILCMTLAIFVPYLAAPAAAQDAKRSLEQVEGDVYRFQNNFHFAMVVETEAGIVVTDPIDAEAVAWLKTELAQKFDKPVTHMIFSHHHADHASGGQAWGDIEVIAHENFPAHVEAGDVDTAMPTQTVGDSHSFELGGKTFELTYLGNGHGDDLIVTVVRPENVAFVVDVVSPKRLPWRDFPGADIDGMIEQIKVVESLDFDILLPGHSVIGTKQDAADTRLYIEHLKAEVQTALDAGKSEADILASDITDNYQDWMGYDQLRDLNIQGMIRWLSAGG
ncbi:MAG: MBL fold metallo-hydrolase [Alphaproteobacteria bacterium]|nr:MBL fold metallo-hydrolase [Alphaproteobacteria bacterium]